MKKACLSLVTALALATPAMARTYALPDAPPPRTDDPALNALQAISQGISRIAESANKGVVLVTTSRSVRGQEGLGSGFLVDLDEGYVITNNHVVEGSREVQVKLANGSSYRGQVVGRDERTDVAVVKIKDKNYRRDGLTSLALADSGGVKIGDIVVALGAPFGLESSVSFGVVSAVGRGNLNITELGDFIQTDAAINPGNSGGPLLDAKGQVIGMNTAIFSRSGAYNGIGFSVPSKLVREVAGQLIAGGSVERGYLGVELQELTNNLSESLRLPTDVKGAVVANVSRNGPAREVGMQAGDVISAVDGSPLKNATSLVNTIGLMRPGSEVKLTIYREGKRRETQVRLAEFPSPERTH